MFASRESVVVALRRALVHRAEWIALGGWIVVHGFHLAFQTGADAYGQFANAILPILVYFMAAMHLRDHPRQYQYSALTILVVLGVVSMLLIPKVYNEPFVARTYTEEYSSPGQIQLIGSWGLFACLAIALPCLLAVALQVQTKYAVWPILLCAAIFALIMLGTFAAAIALLFIGLGGAILLHFSRERRALLRMGATGILLLAFSLAYWRFSNLEQITAMVTKLTEIFNGVASDGLVRGDPTTRGYLSSVSWNTFLEKPLFGVGPLTVDEDNYTKIGRHASIIDGLAQYGILGYGWYLAFLALVFRRIFARFRSRNRTFLDEARMATCLAFFCGGFINPFLTDASFLSLFYFLVLVPDWREHSQSDFVPVTSANNSRI